MSDYEFELMKDISKQLKPEYEANEDPWIGSPFAWILQKPSRQKGKIGEQLVERWCKANEFEVTRSPDSEADRIIENTRVEIKFSTLWTDTPSYTFQQIRDQNYSYVFCLGISPFEVHGWFIPKIALMHPKLPELGHQHGGVAGRDTMWLKFEPKNPPSWLNQYGGTLAKTKKLILGI
jgi:hypothetical protein